MIISFSKLGGGGGGYVLPTATANRLGGIKVGSGLSVDSGGTLSADGGGGDTVVINEMTGAERIQLCATLRANTNAFFNYDLVYVDDSDRGTGVRLTSYRSGENWQGYDWFGGYCNWDGGKYFINVTVNTDDGSISVDVSGIDTPPVAQCKKFNIDVDSAGTETLYTNGISPEQAYAFVHELAGYEYTYSKPLYLIAGVAAESWYTDSIEEMKIYRSHAQAVAARGSFPGAMENAVTVEGRFFNYVTEKWRKLTIASVYQDGAWGWDTPTIVDE